MKYLTIGFLFLVGCSNTSGEQRKSKSISKYALTCEYIGNGLNRCENNETICYVSMYGGNVVDPDCFRKEAK